MLEKIRKFASETSRPIAMGGTRKHTHGSINGVVQPRNEHKMWSPRKALVLHNSRETLARLLNRRIRHLCTTYKMQNVWDFYSKYAMCMMFPCSYQDDPRWSDMTILCAMWYDAMALAYKLRCSSLLLKSFILFFLIWLLCEMHKPR